MQRSDWAGVFPAITTPFHKDFSIDYEALEKHVTWLLDSGCSGIVALGSLGEGSTLTFQEKVEILQLCRKAIGDRAPLVAGISGLGTAECVALAEVAEGAGCDGLMVLPPYVYRGDWREMEAHVSAIITATGLSCMLYNNPIAYGTDFTAAQIEELARHENLHAVKESSGDARRVSAIREVLGDRLAVFVGLDDMAIEGIAVGATGWVAGLVNALPVESVQLFKLATSGRMEEARELYQWFLPLLRFDTVPKFVQLIKLVQAYVGRGTTTVRPPRLELVGEELEEATRIIRAQLGELAAV